MTISDPFGNHLRFTEPQNPDARRAIPLGVPSAPVSAPA
jgi:hypothetical protein